MSTVIGIHDGHNSSVALLRDGRLELALQEERLSRIKNQGDEPAGAVAVARQMAKTGPVSVALNGLYMNYAQWQRDAIVRDYEASSTLSSRLKQPLKNTFVDRAYQRRKAVTRESRIEALGFSRPQIAPVEHHLAHAAAAHFTSPWREEKTLVLTCDGSGDRLSATVSIGHGRGLRRIAEVSEHDSIGRLYALVTRCLGMLPLEHEYKVMGLAPYVSSSRGASGVAQIFEHLFEFDPKRPMVWRRARNVPSMYAAYQFLQRLLSGKRFDEIAAGAQLFLEQMLTAWVRNSVRETGIRRIVCSGGVFMNVKANLAILDLPEVEEMYVFPSCGDESNSIGAACWVASQAGDEIQPLGPLYFADPITDEEAEQALTTTRPRCRFRYDSRIETTAAERLAKGSIVARASGSAEFGARALGNRSILAPADSTDAVRILNEAVKNRDFWMPFAPSVLAERASYYYDKPKPVDSPYMMFAFRSRASRRAEFPAAQHPYDFTTRPQEVRDDHNPRYYRLLKEYEARTGQGMVLNTSFNLHGEPIVHRAADAVDVFLRSGLEYMALGNFWVEKA